MVEKMMTDIPMRSQGALDKDTLLSINTRRPGRVYSAQNITSLNSRLPAGSGAGNPVPSGSAVQGSGAQRAGIPAPSDSIGAGGAGSSMPGDGVREAGSPAQQAPPAQMRIPVLEHPIQKGQKVPLTGPVGQVDACLGWNSTDARCDVDVSAFLLGDNGKVIGDDWFVFYGQTESPDGSTVFELDGRSDQEVIRMALGRLNPAVKKIVFVLTINEAFEKKLHFGMLKDAYIRLLDHGSRKELVSFSMTDYYTNVISMMIGELYLYNGSWKFHGIGNGAAKDLAGLCELYGVQVS